MDAERPPFTERVLVLVVFICVFPPLLLAMFGLLVYPSILEVVRNWFR